MNILSAHVVHARGLSDALARLDDRSGLREAFEREVGEGSGQTMLCFDASRGWLYADLCDRCDELVGFQDDPPTLLALCADCDHAELGFDADAPTAARQLESSVA